MSEPGEPAKDEPRRYDVVLFRLTADRKLQQVRKLSTAWPRDWKPSSPNLEQDQDPESGTSPATLPSKE